MTSGAAIANRSVIAAAIQRNGRFLVCQRPAHKDHGTLWEFPGGKVEPGETFLQAARRELAEELGLRVIAIGEVRIALADPSSGFIINFIDVEVEGDPRLLEHMSLHWLTPEGILNLPLAPTDRKFAEHLNQTI